MTSAHRESIASVTIRPVEEADLPRLLELYFQLSQLGQTPEEQIEPVSGAHRGALRSMQADPRSTCYVLEIDGTVQATYTLYILPNLSHGGRPAAIVENVVVDGSLRGGGYGRLMMKHAESAARDRGCYKVALTSNRRRTDAHRFYERIGYIESHKGFTKYREGHSA